MSQDIKVDYTVVDGAHFFSGRDMLSLGLCVAHTDLKTAFEATIKALNYLIAKNHGLKEPNVESTVPFAEFEAWAKKVIQPPPAPIKAKEPLVSVMTFNFEAKAA